MDTKRISKEEYLKAMEVVNAFHDQIMNDIRLISVYNAKNDISSFLSYSDGRISTRLRNVLFSLLGWKDVIPINEITYNIFIRIRNAGRVTWDEFVELREEFIAKNSQNREQWIKE